MPSSGNSRATSSRYHSIAVLLLILCALPGCSNLVAVPGSTCETDEDCQAYPSCAWRAGGCECKGSVCYLDPDLPYDEELGCRGCHGSTDNPAPPVSLEGLTSTDEIAVGAHQAHMQGGKLGNYVSCDECHAVPDSVNADGHIDDDMRAEVLFGAIATADSVEASWDRASGTCTNYCHGQSLLGGSNKTPQWTTVDGTQAACGTCHGTPPGENHPNDEDCQKCHSPTAGANLTVSSGWTHVDGQLQLTGGNCDTCHGDSSRPEPLNASPPLDLDGNMSSPQVGAHLAHLLPINAAPVTCRSCHVVPQQYQDPGHDDDGDDRAEVTFTGRALATAQGYPAPGYDTATLRCNGTYCHGVATSGGTNGNEEAWDGDSSALACDACHGLPPSTPGHTDVDPPVAADRPCGDCHQDTASTVSEATITGPEFHIDGVVQMSGCGDVCHDVPPSSGAHDRHAGVLGFACATCHGHNGSGPSHIESVGSPPPVLEENIDIVFTPRTFLGGTTISNGGTASYDSVAKRCTVGCHNPIPGNPDENANLANRPTWAAGTLNCGACHDEIGNSSPRNHDIGTPDRPGCTTCHDLANHTDGVVEFIDQDPGDSYVPSLGSIDPLCKGCHDGGGGTFFGGNTPRNVLAGWTASSHGQEQLHCNDCHTYHVSTSNSSQTFVDPGVTRCARSGCHDAMFASGGPFTLSTHHPVGDGANQLRCIHCHNPHLAQAPPMAASNPDDKWTLFSNPVIGATRRKENGVNTSGFCLACHDGSPPAGVPTSAKRISGSDQSQYYKESESLHWKEHDKYNCVSCHDWHGSNGTQGINRQATLQDFITVNRNPPYTGESSCGTPNQGSGLGRVFNGVFVQYTFGCH